MIPSTTERVTRHTAECVNERIRETTEKRVVCSAAGGTEAIDRRIQELDREWDVERALEANAAAAVLLGVVLGTTVSRKWFVFPAIVGGFLLQHAIQGWCPPIPVLRRLGFRTQSEIERERYALKALRGDFRDLPTSADRSAATEAINAASR
ncbi:MAG: YgaP-like transmembrane domain [Thermoguttaceae bacterium]